MTKAKNIELIEKYLAHELTAEELNHFNRRVSEDDELADELKVQKEILDAINDEGKISLRITLEEVHRSRNTIWMYPMVSAKLRSIAAVLLVILVAGGILITNYLTNGVSDYSLYSHYFNPEEALLAVRSVDGTVVPIEEGMKFYQEKNYKEAIEAFKNEPGNLLGKLYSGFSFMQLEKFAEAEACFKEIIADQNNLLIDQAEWNLGLCYLASGEKDDARQLFKAIATGQTVYNNKALELLTKMGE